MCRIIRHLGRGNCFGTATTALRLFEIAADNLSKAGWSWGCVAALDREGRTIWIVDAHRDDGKRFVVHADEKLTAFVELGAVIDLAGSRRPRQLG